MDVFVQFLREGAQLDEAGEDKPKYILDILNKPFRLRTDREKALLRHWAPMRSRSTWVPPQGTSATESVMAEQGGTEPEYIKAILKKKGADRTEIEKKELADWKKREKDKKDIARGAEWAKENPTGTPESRGLASYLRHFAHSYAEGKTA
jgi:hypothetical protein